MAWCNDSKSNLYNKQIRINKRIGHERIFRKDSKYDYFIVIKYNYDKVKKYKGSAIFIHLTKNYKPTKGCIALKKNDLLILLKIINKKSIIKIS